ncbi:MAG: hypothetical protein WD225_03270 [Ilumatobacteraceae bacterium]
MDPRDVITAIAAPTADIGAAAYFHPDTLARGKELGLDGFRFYFLGRGGVLGDVEPEVVVSAFGYFEPSLVAKMWNTGKERIAPRAAAREYLACNADLGRAKFDGLDGLDAYCEAASAVVGAADLAGLTLFAGVRGEPVPDDPPAAAIHYAVLLRELRGSTHLLAVRASGLSAALAHAVRRPDDVAAFGHGEPPEITDDDRAALVRAEELTDELLAPAFSVLDDGAADALVAGTRAMHAALSG